LEKKDRTLLLGVNALCLVGLFLGLNWETQIDELKTLSGIAALSEKSEASTRILMLGVGFMSLF
jgi:hypothetical protein